MRVSSLGVARPAFYDRNASGYIINYSDGLAPHAETNRITVTVAAGKKHSTEVLGTQILRDTAATAAGYAAVRAYITPSGGSITKLVDTFIFTTTVFATDRLLYTTPLTFYAGDQILLQTVDGSTGGTCTYNLVYKSTIFDA